MKINRSKGDDGDAEVKGEGEPIEMELAEQTDPDISKGLSESASETEQWDPLPPGALGRLVPIIPGEDEDEEGRSVSERLVEQGVLEADRDQILKSAQKKKHDDR